MTEKISAIVLNYKHLDDTTSCIRNLKDSDYGGNVDYFVVDNSPVPSTRKSLVKHFPNIHYIASPKNLGFAGGNNLAIKDALLGGSEYILIINPDVTVGKNFFKPLLKHFQNPKVGLVAPLISHSQKNRKLFGLDGKVDWKYAKPEHINTKVVENKKLRSAQFVTFACVIIKKTVFEKIGLIDDGYFMYFEDVDFCLSAKKAGFKILLDPKVVVSHETSSSFAKPTQKLGISFRSHIRFINKWLPLYKRFVPYIYALTLYPYLYLLWTYHMYKYKK